MNTNFIKLIICVLFVNISLGAYAQNQKSTIKGVVIDEITKQPLVGAIIIKDTVTGAGVITDDKGEFVLRNLKYGVDNNLLVEYAGYQNMKVIVKPTSQTFILSTPIVLSTALKVKEIIVYGSAPVAEIKGDTTQYNAGAYKTNPDASAGDLLAKMPGFKQSSDGTVSKEGEAIAKVLVDGKNYFRNDAATALNSLPANIVESIQYIDDQSDESKFTGFDDGSRVKTINIVTKTKQKSAVLGEYYGAYGYGDKNYYTGSANTNIFTQKDVINIGLGANNINANPVSQRGFYGGGSQNGLSSQIGAKFNYDRQIKDGSFSVNYIYNRKDNDALSLTNRTFTADNSTMLIADTSNLLTNTHRLNVWYEQKLNANNKLIIRPSFTYTSREQNKFSVTENKFADEKLNTTTSSKSVSESSNYRINPHIMWFHNFSPKTFFTSSFRGSFSNDESTQFLENNILKYANDNWQDSVSNQKIRDLANSNNLDFNLGLTQRIGKFGGLSLRYGVSYDWSDSDKKTYAWDALTSSFTDINDDLSNTFERDYLNNKVTLGYTYNKNNIHNLNIGLSYKYSALQDQRTYPLIEPIEKYSYNAPEVFSVYFFRPSKSKFMRVMLRSNSVLPSINQLQDVLDVSNPSFLVMGNSNLDQAYRTNLNFMYRSSNIEKSTSLMLFARVTNTQDYFAQNTRVVQADEVIDGVLVQKGARIQTYENLDGMWNMSLSSEYSLPLKGIKSTLNTEVEYEFDRFPSIQDGTKYFTMNNAVGLNLKLLSNITPELDFTIGTSSDYTRSKSDISSAVNVFEQEVQVKLDWIFWKGFFLNIDYNYRYNYLSSSPNVDRHQNILNAGIGKRFLNDRLEVRVSGYDLLNQYQNIFTNTSDQYIETVFSNNLTRYVAFSVKYKINTLKAQGLRTSGSSPQRGMGRGHGMMRF